MAAAFRMIFDIYVRNRLGVRALAKVLNERGHLTAAGPGGVGAPVQQDERGKGSRLGRLGPAQHARRVAVVIRKRMPIHLL